VFPLRLQIILEDRVAAVVAAFSQLTQQHDNVPNACAEAFFDEWPKAIQLRRPWLARAVARHCIRLLAVLADRLTVESGEFGDLGLTHPLANEFFDLIHVYAP
jgi:hypothetical protein